MRQHSLQNEEQALQKQIAGLKAQKQNYLAEVQDAQKRRSNLEADIATETERLIAVRAAKLDAKLGEFSAEITQKRAELHELDTSITDKTAMITSLNHEIEDLEIKKQQYTTDLATIQQQVWQLEPVREELRVKKGEIAKLIDESGKVHAEKLGVQNEISSLDSQKISLLNELVALKEKKELSEAELKGTRDLIQEEVTARDKKIAQLDDLILRKRQEYGQFDIDMERVRQELANRQKQQDDRDMSLRVRERKVEQDEGRIQMNSNLLNL